MSDGTNALERDLLLAIQGGLPLSAEPYRDLATELGTSENEVIEALGRMQDSGLIRRIGLVPNHYALGYRHNLMVVWNIDDARVDDVGETMGEQHFVSHCYRRPRRGADWPYNVFTMIHSRDEAGIDDKVEHLLTLAGDACLGHAALRSSQILKKTGLRLRKKRCNV